MSRRPFLLIYINDFLGSAEVQAMDDHQFAWYLRLLMRAWQHEEPPCALPSDDAKLMRMAGVNIANLPVDIAAKIKTLWDEKKGLVLDQFDTDEHGWLRNKKLNHEYEKLLKIKQVRSEAGSRGGLQRVANAKQESSNCLANSSNSNSNSNKVKSSRSPKANVGQNVLDEIRNEYPRKEDKIASEKAIAKAIMHLCKSRNLEILDAARWLYKRAKSYRVATDKWQPEDRQFIPMCASWMNKGKYDDPDEAWERKLAAVAGGKPAKYRTINDSVEEMFKRD